ncbi:O-antigen ligase family protein [Litorivicinus lipolyticus]|uniref:O-antigen ligase family protein n=1 Tax=Litorivicinus lipolyticus TaxID=418701 RepID=UPI003B5C632C
MTQLLPSLRYQLLVFVFVLPLLEAPKNLLAVTILITGIWAAACGQLAVDQWRASRLLVVVLATLSIACVLPALYVDNPAVVLAESLGWIKYSLVTLVAISVVTTRQHLLEVLRWAYWGGAIAIAWAWYDFSVNGGAYPELNSVGHVNQSAIYVGLTVLIGSRLLLEPSSVLTRCLILIGLIAGLAMLAPMRSIITTGALLIGLFVLLASLGWRRALTGVGAIGALLVGLSMAFPTYTGGFVDELSYRVNSDGEVSSKRVELFQAASVIALANWGLGTGVATYETAVTQEKVEAALRQKGEIYNARDYFYSGHGHGLITTVMVERGVLGLAGFIGLAVLVVARLGRGFDPWDWQWLGVLTAFTAAVSLGNTTFHNEHGALALLLTALLLSVQRPAAKNA